MPTPVTIIRVPRLRRMSLRVNPAGEIIVRAPKRLSEKEIRAFVAKNTPWIEKQQSRMGGFIPLTEARLRDLRAEATTFLPERVRILADKFWFRYQRVSVRHQKSRWGSCSHRNSISLNIELMRLPEALRDYIIVHELVHTVHKHHQDGFWHHLEDILPWALQLDREMKRWKIGYEEI